MSKKITMTDIARECDVSQTLVSFVLSGKQHSIPENTRQRILSAAKKLGYTKFEEKDNSVKIAVVCDESFESSAVIPVLNAASNTLAENGAVLVWCAPNADFGIFKGMIVLSSDMELIEKIINTQKPFALLCAPGEEMSEDGKTAATTVLDIISEKRKPVDLAEAQKLADLVKKANSRDSVWLL